MVMVMYGDCYDDNHNRDYYHNILIKPIQMHQSNGLKYNAITMFH